MSSTVLKALSLLEYFSELEPELGLSVLARRSGIDKSAVHRMLGAMAEAGLIEQQADTKLYRIGAGVLRLARVRETAFPISSFVQPVLMALSEETGETAHASLISGASLGNIGTAESKRGNRVSLIAGEVLPFHSTASGFSVMAFGDDALMKKVLSRQRAGKTRFTLTEAEDIRAKVETVRANGYSESDQTNEEDVHGLAAPVFDRMGIACGAVSVATPSHRVTEEGRQLTIGAVLRAARKITDGLGGRVPQEYARVIDGLTGPE
ncbi:MAG: IclR family transcriptional regulator [Pseudomonadota bacterium]